MTKLFRLLLLLPLFLQAAEEDFAPFVPNDPPRRADAGVEYEPLRLADEQVEGQANVKAAAPVKIVRRFAGRSLVGRINLQLRADLPVAADSVRAVVQIFNETGDSLTVFEGRLDKDGRLEATFDGIYGSSVTVALSGVPNDSDPLADLQISGIVLGSKPRIMLIGDSITDGKFADDMIGCRKALYDNLTAAGQSFDFVGGYGASPYEGHFQSAMKINDFYPQGMTPNARGRMDVTGAMNTYRPNIAAVHLGTNDLYSETGFPITPYGDGSNFYNTQAGELATLINYLLDWHNGRRGTELEAVIVSLIIPIKYQDSVCVALNTEAARLVNHFRNGVITGQPEPVYLCDQFGRFREWPNLVGGSYKALMYDTLHPNNAGHLLMGKTYFETISPLLSGRRKWFTDITWYAGIGGYDHYFENQGTAVADVDGDGLDDLYTGRTNSVPKNPHETLYLNDGNLPFIDRTAAFHLEDNGASRGLVFFDMDNDGDLDLFNGNSSTRNRLYENIGGDFRDVTTDAGIADLKRVTTGVVALDVDNDGFMDLYAVNSREKNELYINQRNGRFALQDRGADDVTEANIPSMSVAAADFDHDGDVDIFIPKRSGANKLFVNNGAGRFNDGAASAGVALTASTNAAVFTDLDGDGDLDLLLGLTRSSAVPSPNLVLYENQGDGTFINRNLSLPMDGYSPLAADFDNDGDIDILATQENDYAVFYRNDGAWRFTKLNDTGAEIHGGDVRGATVLDDDDDGDLDVAAMRADMFNVFLRNNLDNGYHFLKINVKGLGGNAVGYGTKLWIYQPGHLGDGNYLIGYREVQSTGGHISQSSPTQHFGLKNFRQCDLVAQFTDGLYVTLRAVDADQTIELSPPAQTAAKTPALVSYISGDGQQGTVGESLAEPLVVRVSDAQGRPLSGCDVALTVVDGDAQLYLPNLQFSKIALVPESGDLSGSARRAFDETCANQGFIFIPPMASAGGSAKIAKSLVNAGNYSLWLRAFNNGTAATLKARIDGSAEIGVTVSPSADWQWLRVGAAGYSLAAGSHTVDLTLPSSPLQIDQLLLTAGAAYQPTGLEEINEQPELTDDQGLARRFVQLNTQAGAGVIHATLSYNGAVVPNSPIVFNHQALPGPAVSIHENGGNHQSGRPGEPLAEPFVVTVLDAFGNRVANVGVTFTVQSGGGSLTKTNTVLTNDNGRAENTLIPGAASVEQVVRAEAQLTGSPILFYAAVAGLAQKMTLTSGSDQSAVVLSVLPQPVAVRVLTQTDQPVSDYSVVFSTQDGGAKISATQNFSTADSSLTFKTDAQGYARAYWRLGKKSGTQRLNINAGALDGSPMTVQAQALAGPPVLLLKLDGDGQTAVVNRALPKPLAVRLLDASANAVVDFPVIFKSISEGTFGGKTSVSVKTDAGGNASAVFTLGKNAGQQKIAEAQTELNGAPIAGSPAEFYATALADAAALAAQVSGDNQQAVVGSLLQPFVVKITDVFGNPVSGFTVNFTVLEGGGTLDGGGSLAVLSNDSGLAQAVYRLGTVAGYQQVLALNSGLMPATIDFKALALSGNPPRLTCVSGDSQQAVVNTEPPTPLRVRAVDESGAGVAGVAVTFTQLLGDGQFLSATEMLTDETGVAEVAYRLGTKSGLYRIQAASPEYDEHVYFTLRALPEQATRIRIAGGNRQTGVAGHLMNQKLDVQALDRFNNGVPSVAFTFTPQQGHGVVTPSAVLTDSNGVARAEWRLGLVAGEQFLFAASDSVPSSPLMFNAEALPNQPPSLQLPDSLLIDENQLLSFTAAATDVENDSITIIAINLPDGAAFDASGRLFTWTPDFTQAGRYTPAFYAVDHLGASSLRVLPILVRNVNRTPVISLQDSRPLQHDLGQIKAPHVLDFSVAAADPDGDPLKYLWQVNDKRLAVGSSFRLNSQLAAAGATVVQAFVFDASDTVSTTWTLRIISSVELTAFQGSYEPYTGVLLTWQIRHEWQNLGFIVERSMRADGPFTPVSALIPSDASGQYRFCDADVDAQQVVFYRVADVQADGRHNEHEAIRIQPPMPDAFVLHQNFPNPFNSSTTLRFELPEPADVQVIIYDLLGRRARLLLDAPLKPGYHTLAWDGRTDAGLAAASGMYTLAVTQNGQRAIQKMVMVR